jgi:hypothetical protein
MMVALMMMMEVGIPRSVTTIPTSTTLLIQCTQQRSQ